MVIGAGADELILLCARTYLGPGSSAAIEEPTYGLYRIATELAGASITGSADGADVIWVCNPNNPTGELREPAEIAALARAHPAAAVVVDEAYYEYAGATCVPLIAEQPNLIVLRTLSKAFGFASLRVGWAVASPEAAAELELRRPPASVSGPAARIGAAALRDPRIDVTDTLAERERVRAALVAAGHDCPGGPRQLRLPPLRGAARRDAGGAGTRRARGQRRHPDHAPAAARERRPPRGARGRAAPAAGRTAYVVAHEHRDGAARVARPRRLRPRRCTTGIGFLDHLLTLWAFHAGVDLELLAGGDLDVDEHHTVEDVLAALGDALAEALGDRQGIARYGAATVPMDEASATAAVDLVRRPHAEISLAFTGERVGGLALSLLPHALERFAHAGRLHDPRHRLRHGRPSRRRGGVQGARPGAAGGVRTGSRRRPVDEGPRVKVVLADYGAGNLRSVCSALARAGAEPVVTSDPAEVAAAPLAIVAGVGHAARAAAGSGRLRTCCATASLPAGPCSASASGSSSSSSRATRAAKAWVCSPAGFAGSTRRPCRTWAGTSSRSPRPSRILDGLDGADVYFAHSYAVQPDDDELVVARVDHAGAIVAAVEDGALAGVQFHPERSGAAGARVLENVLQWSRSA